MNPLQFEHPLQNLPHVPSHALPLTHLNHYFRPPPEVTPHPMKQHSMLQHITLFIFEGSYPIDSLYNILL